MATVLPQGVETTLGLVTPTAGAMTSVTIDRTVSPNAISAPPLNSLTSAAAVTLTVYATTDGVSFHQIAKGGESGGAAAAGQPGSNTICSLAVSATPGELQHKVTATASTQTGVGATVAASAKAV